MSRDGNKQEMLLAALTDDDHQIVIDQQNQLTRISSGFLKIGQDISLLPD